ncbi:nicotinamide n-methyltransferase [Bachmanniomyces sp. S44760]|nr:nicotinamide n-methyltransferase [Bachmanniomyces sp. S44760]
MQPSSEDEEDATLADLFADPPDYFPPPKPSTHITYVLQNGDEIKLQLVGHNPLWGHLLWNAGQVVSEYLQNNEAIVNGKQILELGAGAGLPSIVSAILGATNVVVTDYPDEDLIENLKFNIAENEVYIKSRNVAVNIRAEGYVWGSSTTSASPSALASLNSFDLLILADVLFNHSEHGKLISTIRQNLKKPHAGDDSRVLVFFTPYRPWLLDKDMAFFDLAREEGFRVEKVLERVMDWVMFKDDQGVNFNPRLEIV